MALFIPLDVNYPENYKVIEAGLDGAGLHTFALCLAKRMEADGWIPWAALRRMGASDDLIERLVNLRLLELGEDGRVRPWGWLDRNPSQGAIDANRATKAEAAKAGNHKRWDHPGPVDKCRKCNPFPQVVAGSDSDGSHPDRSASPLGSPEQSRAEQSNTSLLKSENHSDRDPAQAAGGDEDAAEQRIRRTARLVGEAVAHAQVGVANRAGYAAKVTRDILQGDGIDRERITRMLADGQTETEIAEGWQADPFGMGASTGAEPGPDLKALYEAQQERTAEQLAEQHRDPPEATADARAAARAALRGGPLEVVR